jgi:hypothetical protein
VSAPEIRVALRPPAKRAASCLLLLLCCAATARAASGALERIVCRPELADARRQELAAQLREITGWPRLRFDEEGFLNVGGADRAVGGSAAARELLRAAARGPRLLVVEDASGSADVVFSRVVEARWTAGASGRPQAFLIQVDFADFERVTGDRAALAAFNAAWGVLHEVAHVVRDAADAEREGELGDCEALVNLMRRECGLAERAEYHHHFFPGQERSEFGTRLVRLAFFERAPETDKRRRLYVMWDAAAVGGLGRHRR